MKDYLSSAPPKLTWVGIKNTRRKRRKNKDGAVLIADDPWRPPPEEYWAEEEDRWILDNGFTIVSRDAHDIRDPSCTPVFFALMLFHESCGDRELARIDTRHDEVHVHQLHASKPDDDVGFRTTLCQVKIQDHVSEWRYEAFERLEENAEEYKRKWEHE